MKLVRGIVGTPIRPDYDLLRGALIAASAATATGRAAVAMGLAGDPGAAWRTMLAIDATAPGNDAVHPATMPWPAGEPR